MGLYSKTLDSIAVGRQLCSLRSWLLKHMLQHHQNSSAGSHTFGGIAEIPFKQRNDSPNSLRSYARKVDNATHWMFFHTF